MSANDNFSRSPGAATRQSSETASSETPSRTTTLKESEQSASNAARLAPGFQARYEIYEQVGRGAMGIVFRGRHRLLDSVVAIKLCPASQSLHRFRREATLLARLKSPHVVTVHDFEELPDGRAF